MKSILMSIKPQWVAKILNGEKTIEIRKKFPKDYVGWVYIYCTKDKKYIYRKFNGKYFKLICSTNTLKQEIEDESTINGQVVARFWCDKVEEITPSTTNNFTKDSCLTIQELENYLWSNILFGYAIHITNLEIFDSPKEISEFWTENKAKSCSKSGCPYYATNKCPSAGECHIQFRLTRAPQSWCYVEI